MSQAALLMQTLGRIEAKLEAGFQEQHRRLETQDRNDMEWRRHMLKRMDNGDRRRRNGNGHIPYGKISVLLLLIVIGTLGHLAPTATRAAIQDVLRIGLRQLTAG
jgi:hypothetical protein